MIPVLIAAQGGYLTGGDRGRITGAIAVIGCIVDAPGTTMLMGAMVIGPFSGWVIKRFDEFMDGRTPAGFEMLIDNFSVGLIGMALAMIGYLIIDPVMNAILAVLMAGVQVLIDYGLMPLLAIFIEPAKVLFLNNAINHGIFTPIGIAQAPGHGRSIMYMPEANPGPGLGVLLAHCLFCKEAKTRQSAPGAVIIHFFGGIHEIYFPYVLMNPKVIIAPICGNAAAIAWFGFTGCGLTSAASPGSIFAFLAMTPSECMIQVIIGVCIAAAVSFVIASPIVRAADVADIDSASEKMREMKVTSEAVVVSGTENGLVVFACDAGMGSSAMGATRFRNRIKAERPDLTVKHSGVDNVTGKAKIVVCQRVLSERARKSAPQAQIVEIDNFLDDPALDVLYESLNSMKNSAVPAGNAPTAKLAPAADPDKPKLSISAADIQLGCKSVGCEQAIRDSGALLVKRGYVKGLYVDAMVERDKLTSVYIGMGIAIPRGTNEAKDAVENTGVVLQQYPDGVDFDGEKAQLVFGIAGKGEEHLEILANICRILEDEEILEKLKTTDDLDWALSVLS